MFFAAALLPRQLFSFFCFLWLLTSDQDKKIFRNVHLVWPCTVLEMAPRRQEFSALSSTASLMLNSRS